MISWTTPAKEEIDSYLNNVRASIATSGADASEVIDDLKRHIEEEIHTAQLEMVTRDDVRRIVHRLGIPENGGLVAVTESVAPPPKQDTRNGYHHPMPRPPEGPGGALLAFGVILPFFTLVLELFTHFCASTFFDPLPSFWHVLVVAAVPTVNLVVWRALRNSGDRRWAVHGWCSAMAAGIALFYTFRYMLLLPAAVVALIFFGLGLLPLTPLLTLIATLRLRHRLSRTCPLPVRNLVVGMAAGVALVIMIDVPVMLTYAGMSMADAKAPATRAQGIGLLRAFGNDGTMLRACYGRGRAAGEMDAYSMFVTQPVSPETAREIYYRVHGQSFNAVRPPAVFTTRGRWTAVEREFTWDADQGGDAVAGRVKGLALANSRLDGLIDSEGAVGYVEWTLEFRNVSSLQREARAQILLPPGGVVSRLTLWVNGEEREAAFAGRSEVRQAYQNVVVQRRDPVLVTSAGPDRVLMQCFPVPPDGGTIKVRLGITAPVSISDERSGVLTWPCFVERNFTIHDDFRHNIWMESRQELSAEGLAKGRTGEGAFTLHGEVSEIAFSALRVSRRTPWQTTVASDPRQAGQFVRQTIAGTAAPAIENAYVVLDSSVSMDRHLRQIADAFNSIPQNVRVTVFVPRDEDVRVVASADRQALVREVRGVSAAGGRDNVPALLHAWDMAASNANSVVVWIHGAQPSTSRAFEQLKQRLDWHAQSARIIDVPVEPAPNRLIEKLEAVPAIRTLPRTKSLRTDLERLFQSWKPGAQRFEVTRELVNEQGSDGRGSSHVVRLWAYDQIEQFIRRRHTTRALELAGLYQLVTPVSGAVVLETQQQFQQAGLTPVDASTVPSVPEPATWALIIVAVLALCLYRKLRSRIASGLDKKRAFL